MWSVERCQPLFQSLGQKTFVVGAEPSQANLVKLLGNMMTATTLETLQKWSPWLLSGN